MGYGSHNIWWLVAKLAGFIIGSYVFSYIFWSTKQCVEKHCKIKPKAKKR